MKINILGGSPNGRLSDTHLNWVHGNQLDRWDTSKVHTIFEIHDDLSEHGDPDKYANWLVSHGIPLVVGEKFPVNSPLCTVFPFDKANRLLEDKLSSTPAYMMAYAILEKANEIRISGVDMAVDNHEYFLQRPDMYAWIGYAQGIGVKVEVEPLSPLYKHVHTEGKDSGGKPDFALPPFTQLEFANMANQHITAMERIQRRIEQLNAEYQSHDGARQAYERLEKVARGVEAGQTIRKLTDSAIIKGA